VRRYRLGHIRDNRKTKKRSVGNRVRTSRFALPLFELTDDELNTHLMVTGTTGGGKSRFLWQLLREHRRNGRGCGVIEPGDLIDDFLADCAREVMETGNCGLLKKLHVVELSPFQEARYDPFHFFYPKSNHPEMRETVYRSWQHTKVQSVAEVYQWKQGQSTDFEGMPNLQRNFINMFTSVSTLVEDRRLSAGDADILIDLNHPDHERVYLRLEPHLPREIVADFEVLHQYRNVRDLRHETGSFLNRIRATHGPLFKEMISADGRQPVLDLFQIIQRGDFLLVKTAKTPFASNDQNLALASLFFHDVAEVMLVTPRDMRKQFTLMVDEAHKIVRPGVGDLARTARKYGLGLVFATTDLASLKRADFDLGSELLNVVNTVIAYRMTWPEDLKTFAEFLYAQNIDFTELLHEVERRAGQEWLQVDEWSETAGRQTSKATSNATTLVSGTSLQEADGRGQRTTQSTSFDALGNPRGTMQGSGNTASHVATHGRQESESVQSGITDTEGESYAITINHKLVHIERIVREIQKTGLLEQAVSDQLARFAQELSSHAQRHATARVREREAVHIETAEVKDPFCSPEAQARAVEWIRRELYRVHDYYFTPCLDPQEQSRRIDEFVGVSNGGRLENQRVGDQSVVESNPLL